MTVFDAVRSAPTRYALVFAGLSALVMGALLALCYAWMTVVLERHVEVSVEQQLVHLRDDFQLNGRDSVISLVSRHAARRTPSTLHFLVQDNEGRVLAGDLPRLALRSGWQEVELSPDPAHRDTSPRTYRGFGARLDDATHVLVMQETADLTLTRSLLIRSFSIALFVTVALALVGGVTIGATLLRRVDDVDRVARAIVDGDLSRRIPVVGWRDELGGLAEGLNRMLDRIEDLMNNVRHVTSSVAHDLRSPLSRYRQRLETVRRKPRSPAEYESAIDASIEGTDEILKTFDAILRIAQIEAGTPRARFAPVDLGEIAENVGDAFAAVAEDEMKHLVWTTQSNAVVSGDRELLTQMVVNLTENCLRHTPTGSSIELCVEAGVGRHRIVVSDNGAGIPPDERDRVFAPFYRRDTSRSTPGSGLGLSFVAAVVKLHDATIALEDNEPGLRVLVTFPAENR